MNFSVKTCSQPIQLYASGFIALTLGLRSRTVVYIIHYTSTNDGKIFPKKWHIFQNYGQKMTFACKIFMIVEFPASVICNSLYFDHCYFNYLIASVKYIQKSYLIITVPAKQSADAVQTIKVDVNFLKLVLAVLNMFLWPLFKIAWYFFVSLYYVSVSFDVINPHLKLTSHVTDLKFYCW